jgi:very-short-patch-repair endonuclease
MQQQTYMVGLMSVPTFSGIDWENPQIIDGVKRYPVIVGCPHVRLLKASDARKAERNQSPCFMCSQKRKAKLGYAAMCARWGEKWAVRHMQAWQLKNPTRDEQRVARLLDDLGVRYTRQYWLATKTSGKRQRVYLLDFVVDHQYVIQVNGGIHVLHVERDRRCRSLIKRRGMKLLELTTQDVRGGDALPRLKQFLEPVLTSPIIHYTGRVRYVRVCR